MKEHKPEVWENLDVEGCGYRYEISSYGRVYDKIRESYVSQVPTGKPKYFYVNLQPIDRNGVKGKRLLRRVHNLVAQVFIENTQPDIFDIVDHIDQNKYNNSLDNLRWADRKTNSRNTKVNNTMVCGMLLKDYCEENNLPLHSVLRVKYENPELSSEECIDKYFEDRLFCYRGDYFTRNQVCSKYGEDVSLLLKYFTLEDILDKGYKTPLVEKDYANSLEVSGVWYPTKKYIKDYYNLSDYKTEILIEKGFRFKELMKYLEDSRKVEYNGESKTWEEWAQKLGVKVETLKGRYFTKKWPLYKVLSSGSIKIKYYNFNGKRVTKKYIWEYFNICARTANSYHCKHKNKTINLILEEKYLVDLENYHISPWVYN